MRKNKVPAPEDSKKHMLAHMENIRRRYMQKKQAVKTPEERCHKCGVNTWYPDDTSGGWYCFPCGARGHFAGEKFVQY